MTTPDRPRRATLLIVDDSDEMRALIRALVGDVAGEIHECADGADAVTLYERLRPEVVLMDVRMRDVDGITATRRIRSVDPRARVVIVSEHGGESARRAARRAGASGFLLKDNLLELPELLAAQLRAAP